jgi:hypothetical protein
MKVSVETKVAAAVAAGFIALTVGAIGQGRSGGQAGGPNNYGPTNNPAVNTNMSQQGYNNSLPGRTNAEENRQKFSDENATAATQKNVTKSKSGKSSKHHTGKIRQNEGTQTNGTGH